MGQIFKTFNLFVPFSFILLLSCQSQEDMPKGKLFIIGGGDKSIAMLNRMMDEAGVKNIGYVLILPMSSEEPDSAFYYAKEDFAETGIKNICWMNLKKGDVLSTEQTDSIKNCRLIYITGGDQSLFMNSINGTRVLDAIQFAYHHGSMIGGTSAGAALMSEKMITGNQKKYHEYEPTSQSIESDNIEIMQGLGLLKKSIIDQHFVVRSRYNRLLSVVIEHPEMKGVGIDESTAIIVHNGIAEVIGDSQVIVLDCKDKTLKNKNEKLGAVNINMSIYLPGDKFSLE